MYPDYLNFSQVGGKEKLNELIDRAHGLLIKIADAPESVKPNLMMTDFKIAVAAGNIVKAIVQAESANKMAIAVLADRIKESEAFIQANIPGLKLKKIPRLRA